MPATLRRLLAGAADGREPSDAFLDELAAAWTEQMERAWSGPEERPNDVAAALVAALIRSHDAPDVPEGRVLGHRTAAARLLHFLYKQRGVEAQRVLRPMCESRHAEVAREGAWLLEEMTEPEWHSGGLEEGVVERPHHLPSTSRLSAALWRANEEGGFAVLGRLRAPYPPHLVPVDSAEVVARLLLDGAWRIPPARGRVLGMLSLCHEPSELVQSAVIAELEASRSSATERALDAAGNVRGPLQEHVVAAVIAWLPSVLAFRALLSMGALAASARPVIEDALRRARSGELRADSHEVHWDQEWFHDVDLADWLEHVLRAVSEPARPE